MQNTSFVPICSDFLVLLCRVQVLSGHVCYSFSGGACELRHSVESSKLNISYLFYLSFKYSFKFKFVCENKAQLSYIGIISGVVLTMPCKRLQNLVNIWSLSQKLYLACSCGLVCVLKCCLATHETLFCDIFLAAHWNGFVNFNWNKTHYVGHTWWYCVETAAGALSYICGACDTVNSLMYNCESVGRGRVARPPRLCHVTWSAWLVSLHVANRLDLLVVCVLYASLPCGLP